MTTIDTDREVVEISDERLGRLRVFNAVMGLIHLLSGTLMIALGNDTKLPTSTFNLDGPPGTPLADGTFDEFWGVPLALGTAAFMLISALFHFIIAAPGGFALYSKELRRGRNRF